MSDAGPFRRYRLAPDSLLFFLHIERTGGNTIRYILENTLELVLGSKGICPAFHWHELEEVDLARAREFDLVRGHFTYGDGPSFYGTLPQKLARLLAAQQSISITCLRHPVERALSQYRHIQSASDHYMHERASGMSFEAFVRDPWTSNSIANYQARSVVLASCPGVDPSALSDRDLLSHAKTSLRRFALVGITEQMGATLKLLDFVLHWDLEALRTALRREFFPRQETGWPDSAPPDPAEALQLNASREDREGALAAGVRQAIEERNAADLALYAFSLKRFSEQIAWMNSRCE